jgi:DNA-binding transcriptional LysR family regulator
MLDIRAFRQFIAVAEERSFRGAAARLHMAQPPLTAAIKRLESELGATLIERGNRVTALTPAGQVFLEEARRTLAQAERTIHLARRAAAGLSGSLRVGFVASAVRHVLPTLIAGFRATHPDVALTLTEAPTARQARAIHDDVMDVGIVAMPLPEDVAPSLSTRLLMDSELMAALPASHPLARKKRVKLADMLDHPWILFPEIEGPGLSRIILDACAKAGGLPTVAQRAIQMETITGLVAAGLGMALVPAPVASCGWTSVEFRKLAGPGAPVPYRLALAWRKDDAAPALQAFVGTNIQ